MRLPENPMPRRMTVLDDIPPGVRASMAEDYVRREMSLKRIAKERGMPVCRVRAVMLSEGVKLRSAKETAPLRYKQALLEQRLRGE